MTYALDSSGAASANLVTGEAASVNTQSQISDTYVFPQQGPFYENGLIIVFTPLTGPARPLVPKVDYEPAFAIKGVVTGNDIFGAIRLINKALVGTITYNYQALGGIWNLLQATILQVVSTTAIDPVVAYFGLVPSPPITIPGTTANLALSSSTSVALAQSLFPAGVSLTISAFELPEAEQITFFTPAQPTGTSGGGTTPGAPDMSSNYAQETGGNLAIAATELTALAQGQAAATAAQQAAATSIGTAGTAMTAAATAMSAAAAGTGAVTDVAYGGSGNGSLVSIEKANFAKLAEMDGKMSSGVVVTGPAAAALALDSSLNTINASVQQLLTAVKGTQAIDGSVWVDITLTPAHYYIRREVYSETLNAYVVSWENADGTVASPTLANLTVAGASSTTGANSVDQINLTYAATSAGTGYASGDILMHSYGLNTSTTPASVTYSVWFNGTQGSVLTAPPTNGTFAQVGMSTVSVSATVLAPNASQETGGNLAAIAAATGTQADAAWVSGNGTLTAIMKAVVAAMKGVLNIRALTSATDSVTVDGTGATGVNQLAGGTGTQGWLSGIFSKLASTLPVSLASLPGLGAGAQHVGSVTVDTALPAGANTIGGVNVINNPVLGGGTATIGAVTAPGGGALATSADMLAMTNAIKATVGITGTVWFDPTVNPAVYYVRRESVNEGTGVITVAWVNPDGTAATPSNLANLQISGDAQNLQTENITYTATATATGYTTGDVIIHALAIDRSTSLPAVAYNFWINASAGTVLASAPTAGNIAQSSASTVSVTSSALPTNAAQETGGNLAAIAAATGTQADAAWSGTGSGSVLSVLKAMWGRLTGVQYMIASDGVLVPFESLSQTMVWTGTLMTSVFVSYQGHTYTQTLTYDGSNNLTGQSQLVMS